MGDSSHWQRIRSPAAAGARETKTTNDATSALGEPSVSFAAAQLAIGVFGAAIVLSYPVGFITLWVQIMDTYGYVYSDALYATSMVPSSVVAGQAVFVLLGAPIAVYIMYFLAALYAWMFEWQRKNMRKNKTRMMLGFVLYFGVMIVVYIIPFSLIGYYAFGLGTLSLVKAYVCGVALISIWLCGLISGLLFQRGTRANGSGRYTRSVIIAGIPFVVGAFITGVCTNILLFGISLPTVELLKENSDERVEGTLLTHMDGSWHLINSSQPNHPLITVPNERVFKVKIAEQ
jgi:hypothetical protein